MQEEDQDTDGLSIAADAILLNDGSIKAAADGTTDADLTHAAVPDDATRKPLLEFPIGIAATAQLFTGQSGPLRWLLVLDRR